MDRIHIVVGFDIQIHYLNNQLVLKFNIKGSNFKTSNIVRRIILTRTWMFQISPNLCVNSTIKFIELILNDESKLLKSFYLTSDTLIYENFKLLN